MVGVRDADLAGKKVFLRVDFNVPIENGKIVDDNRIEKTLPTIKFLLEKKAKIIIATHLGKPRGKIVKNLSTIILAKKLAAMLGKEVFFTDHVIHPLVRHKAIRLNEGEILFIGNLRWHKEEEENSEPFARELAKYAEIYVNDAFGASHRAHASIEAITRFLPSYPGILLESEITTLNLLLSNPKEPFFLVLGGAKMEDKIAMIDNLAPKVEKILVGGAIANTFMAAKGDDVSKSLYQKEMLNECNKLLKNFADKILLPIDSQKKQQADNTFKILDIGPQTSAEYVSEIHKAKTVFWNGNMGYSEDDTFARGTKEIAEAVSNNSGTTVIAGGDTVGFVKSHNLDKRINFISTGGGATLMFMSGKGLPGIEAIKRSQALN